MMLGGALAPNAVAAKIIGCEDLLEIDQDRSFVNWALGGLEKLFMVEEDSIKPDRLGAAEFWVTVQPGRFSNFTCEKKQYEDQEMYPIGIMVKPLGVLDLPTYVRTGRGTPILVLTEYGHRKIVSLNDIAPITSDAIYIFAEGVAEATYCKAIDPCPGNQPVECNSGIWRCTYKVGAVSGYARTQNRNDDTTEIIRAFQQLNRDKILQREEGVYSPQRVSELQSKACRAFPAHAHRPGGSLHQRRPLALSLCALDGEGIVPLKVIDTARAEEKFTHGLMVSFHRELGSHSSLIADGLRNLVKKQPVFVKKCGESIKSEDTFSLGGGLGADANIFNVVTFEMGAERENATTYIETVAANEYLLYTTYFIRPIPILGTDTDEKLWVFDIVFRAGCEGGEPRSRSSVVIYYKDLPQGYIPIGVKEGIFTNYRNKWGNASFTEGTNPAQIYQGHFWVIKDHLAYYYWRDALRDYLYDEIGVIRALIQRYPAQQQPLVRDFFVFLFLSAAYDHHRPIRYIQE